MSGHKSQGARRRKIPKQVLPPKKGFLRFSFRHLQLDHPKFKPSDCPVDFFVSLMQRLRDCSLSEMNEVLDENHHKHRHQIDFNETSEQGGFVGAPGVDPDQVGYAPAWQFALGDDKNWRIHGFLIDETFYIVWLDPLHKLYRKTSW